MNWKEVNFTLDGIKITDGTTVEVEFADPANLMASLPEGVAFIQAAKVRREDIKPVLDTDGSIRALSYTHTNGSEFQSAPITGGLQKLGETFNLSETALRWHKEGFAVAIETFLNDESVNGR